MDRAGRVEMRLEIMVVIERDSLFWGVGKDVSCI